MRWIERVVLRNRLFPAGSPNAYLVAVALVLLATIVRLALDRYLHGVPFVTFFPAVLVAAIVGGGRAGLLAAALGGIAALYFFLPPYYSFSLADSASLLGLLLYLLVAAFDCALVSALRAALLRLDEARQREHALTGRLEERVAERTAALEQANRTLAAEIREREAMEAALRQSQKMEAIGRLTGGVAHDFNNMLTAMMGSVERLQRRLPPADRDLHRMAENALLAATRAASLTGRLLAFARQQALQPDVVSVNTLVAGMTDLLRRTLGEQFQIETVLAGGLWLTRVDPNQLESALLNLVINARDAMGTHGRLTIETANTHLDEDYARNHDEVTAGQYVMVSVSDTGAGMTAEVAARAFDPFFTTKAPGEGTGLGLSMVYGFLKQSGGHAKIYSEPGVGTTVKLYLPRYFGETTARRASPSFATTPRSRTRERILVVDDEELVRDYTVAVLQELGYAVREAENGPAALAVLREEGPVDLLLTDVGLPGMNGRQLAEAARGLHPALRVLYTTGYARNAIVHNGTLDPGVALLPKPYRYEALAEKVHEVLGQAPG